YESLQDARTGNSPLNSSYQNQNNPQTIYASYDSFNECPDIVSFDLILQQNPIFEMVDFYKKCFGESIEITAPDGFSYIWNTGETSQHIVVESEGEYFVEISNLHCSVTRQIFVE